MDHVFQAHLAECVGLNVIVLDQDAIGQIQPVVVAAAHAHRIFVQVTVAGDRLSSVHYSGVQAFNRLNIAVGVAGDTTHPLHEIQRDALSPENPGRRATDHCDVIPGREWRAVLQDRFYIQCRVNA